MIEKKIYLLGNSQLGFSAIRAFCGPEVFAQCETDWLQYLVTRGEFKSGSGIDMSFLFCNMGLLGDPAFENGLISHSPAFTAFLDMIDPDVSAIFLMLRGNEFGSESLVDSTPPWDFSYKGVESQKGRQFVNLADAEAYFDQVTNALLATCLYVKHKFPNIPVYHIATVPPIESEEYLRKFPEPFGPLFDIHGIRPFAQRKKIYDLMYERLSTQLRPFGVESIFTPEECLTEAGGLRADYSVGCLHGNESYGRALIEKLEKEFINASV